MSEAEAQPRVYSVKEFANSFARWLAEKPFFSNIAIAGEISDLHRFGTGHVGFRLKEEQAVIECVAWSDRRRALPEVKNGMAVIAFGAIGVRQDRGCYQLTVERLEPTGLGALFVQFERLKEMFRAEGLFDDARKRHVPELPRRIALISARGKGMEDFVRALARRAPFVEVTFIETQVQGLGSEIEIASAIDRASTLDVDAVVLTRGGGSPEDLFPFNLEPVVRGIVRSRHPVITAIGHSEDHHLADFVADRSFGTPSLAAEQIAQGWVLALRRVREAERALARAAQSIVMQAARRAEDATMGLRHAGESLMHRRRSLLSDVAARLDRRSPQRTLMLDRERLLKIKSRVELGALRFVNETRRAVDRAGARLDAVDPQAPLKRGYAIVTHAGAAVRDAAVLRKGAAIEARFEHGSASAVVEGTTHDE